MDGSINPIDPCVGQLVSLIVAPISNRYISIPRSGGQEDLLGLAIDRHDDVDVRTRHRGHRSVGIDPADIDVKGIGISICFRLAFDLTANLVGVYFLQFFGIAFIYTREGIFKVLLSMIALVLSS